MENNKHTQIPSNEEWLKHQAEVLAAQRQWHKEYQEKLAKMTPEERAIYIHKYIIA